MLKQHVVIVVTDFKNNGIRHHNEAVRKKIQYYEKSGIELVIESATSSLSSDNKLITTVLVKEIDLN